MLCCCFKIVCFVGPDSLTLINQTLLVGEGNLLTISNASLFLKTKEADQFVFHIEKIPAHGDLIRMTQSGRSEVLNGNSTFTTQDILSNMIFYQHDDSETTNDTFR